MLKAIGALTRRTAFWIALGLVLTGAQLLWRYGRGPEVVAVAAQLGTAVEIVYATGGDHIDKRPDQLSGGQRQRVAVARALANEPLAILADEPTGSLDTTSSEQVFQMLRHIVDDHGKTVIAVTYHLGLADRMDRRIQLVDGAITSDDAVVRT